MSNLNNIARDPAIMTITRWERHGVGVRYFRKDGTSAEVSASWAHDMVARGKADLEAEDYRGITIRANLSRSSR